MIVSFVVLPVALNKSDPRVAVEFSAQCTRLLVPLMLAGATVFVFGSQYILYLLYGEEFVPATTTMQIYAFGACVMGVQLMLGNILQAVDRIGVFTGIIFSGLVANLALNLWLIPTYADYGAALASTLSYLLQTILAVIYIAKAWDLKASSLLFINKADVEMVVSRLKSLRVQG